MSEPKTDGGTLGKIYELQLLTLFFQKAQARGYQFDLGREVSDAGKFDDLVFKYLHENGKIRSRYLQSKHVMDRNKKITSDILFPSERVKNDTFVHNFQLNKYFLSFIDIKCIHLKPDSGDLEDLIMFTTADFDVDELKRKNITLVERTDPFLNFSVKGKESKLYNIKLERDHVLYEKVKDWSYCFSLISELLLLIKIFISKKGKPEKEKVVIFSQKDSLCERFAWILQQEKVISNINNKIKFKEEFLQNVESLSSRAKEFKRLFFTIAVDRYGWKEEKLLEEAKETEFQGNKNLSSKNQNSLTILPIEEVSNEDVEDFFEHILFAVNQPNSDELMTVIKDYELRKSFKSINTDFIASSLMNKLLIWIKNMKGGEGWISSDVSEEFFREANRLISSMKLVGLTLLFRNELEAIQFQNSINDHLRKFLESEDILLEIETDQTFFTCVKINSFLKGRNDFQEEDSCVFLSTDFLESKEVEEKILEALKTTKSNLIVLECKTLNSSFEKEVRRFSLDMKTKVIIIAQKFPAEYKQSLITKDNNTAFGDLTLSSQEDILSMQVMFQGSEIEFNRIISENEPNILGKIFDKERITKMVRMRKKPKIAKNIFKLDLDDDFYVNRIFRVQKEIKIEECKPHGSPSLIGGLPFSETISKELCEEDFWSFTSDQSVIILSGEAGMGKSSASISLAKKIKKANPNLWILKINLNDYASVFRKEKKTKLESKEDAISFFRDKILKFEEKPLLKTDADAHLLEYFFRHEKNLLLFLDGFDEISPNYESIVLNLIQKLKETNALTIIISTRPHLKNKLERKLVASTTSTLLPFTDEERIRYLAKFWCKKNSKFEDERRVTCYAKSLIEEVSNSVDEQLTGIPLQTRMLAEIFGSSLDDSEMSDEEEDENESDYEDKENEETKEKKIQNGRRPLISDTLETFYYSKKSTPEIHYQLNLCQLYEKFIRRKFFNVYEKDGVDCAKLGVRAQSQTAFKEFLFNHKLLALKTLIPEDILNRILPSKDLLSIKNLIKEIKNGKNRNGLVNRLVDEIPEFVHSTFAEYFLAEFLFDQMQEKEKSEELLHFLFWDILLKGHHRAVRKFLNEKLREVQLIDKKFYRCKGQELILQEMEKNKNCPIHVAIAEHNMETVKFLEDCLQDEIQQAINFENFENLYPIEAAVSSGNLEGSKWLIDRGANLFIGPLLVHKAVYSNNTDILKLLIKEGVGVKELTDNFTLLHFAILYENYEMVKFFMENVIDLNEANTPNKKLLLQYAAQSGKPEILKAVASKFENINETNSMGTSILQLSAEKGDLESVKFLVAKDADIHHKDDFGNSVLHYAAESGNAEILKFLSKRGAEIKCVNKFGNSPLHLAASMGSEDSVKFLVKNGLNVNQKELNGNTVLHYAAKSGNTAMLEFLIKNHANVNEVNLENDSALLLAMEGGNFESVRCLVENGADVNHKHEDGYSVLNCSVGFPNLEAFELLVEKGANINEINSKGASVLQLVSHIGPLRRVKFLIERNADIFHKDNNGNSALHYAAEAKNKMILPFLVEKEANIHEANNDGVSVLQTVARIGCLDRIKYLLLQGANILHKDAKGNTILHYAALSENTGTLEHLIENGTVLDEVNNIGDSPLQAAVKFECPKSAELFIRCGANIRNRNEYGETALHYAIEHPSLKLLKLLVENDADLNQVNYETDCITQVALKLGNLNAAKYLIKQGASVHFANLDDNSVLHSAILFGDLEILRLVLQKDVDVNCSNILGISPLQLAAQICHLEKIKLLIEKGANVHWKDKEFLTVLDHVGNRENKEQVLSFLRDKMEA